MLSTHGRTSVIDKDFAGGYFDCVLLLPFFLILIFVFRKIIGASRVMFWFCECGNQYLYSSNSNLVYFLYLNEDFNLCIVHPGETPVPKTAV